MKKNIVIVFGVFLLLIFQVAYAFAEQLVSEGYDENTEIVIKGAVTEIDADGRRGPVVIRVASGSRIYNIATAPAWYLIKNDISFQIGENLEVMGSKYLSRDGIRYIIAKQIKNVATGNIINFRDPQCRPLWRGNHMFRRN
jgi:hypothetical protein